MIVIYFQVYILINFSELGLFTEAQGHPCAKTAARPGSLTARPSFYSDVTDTPPLRHFGSPLLHSKLDQPLMYLTSASLETARLQQYCYMLYSVQPAVASLFINRKVTGNDT